MSSSRFQPDSSATDRSRGTTSLIRACRVILVGFCLAAVSRPAAARAQCVGDCDDGGTVTVDELVIGVNVALGGESVSRCPLFDGDQSGSVTVNELVSAVSNALNGCPATSPIERGLRSLAAGNLRRATAAFNDAVVADPNDPRANLYLAVTRVPTAILDDPVVTSLLQAAGIVIEGGSEDICQFQVVLPDQVPLGAPRSQEIFDALGAALQPAAASALGNLDRVPATFTDQFELGNFPECVRPGAGGSTVEIDSGETILLRSILHATAAGQALVSSYDLDFDLQTAIDGPVRTLLEGEPQLFMLRDAEPLALGGLARQVARPRLGLEFSRVQFGSAFEGFNAAVDEVRREHDNQDDDIFVIMDSMEADKFRLLGELLRAALSGQVTVPVDLVRGEVYLVPDPPITERWDFSPVLSGGFSDLRGYLPAFDGAGNWTRTFPTFPFGIKGSGSTVVTLPPQRGYQFPDTSFGNIAPDLTQEEIDNFFVGGPPCGSCAADSDCNHSFSRKEFACFECQQGCTGATRRCGQVRARTSCEDGDFSAPASPTSTLTATPATSTPTAVSSTPTPASTSSPNATATSQPTVTSTSLPTVTSTTQPTATPTDIPTATATPTTTSTITSTPVFCADKADGRTCDAGNDGAVLTCFGGECMPCVPAGRCSMTTGTSCAFDPDCPGSETCGDPSPGPRYVDNDNGTVTDRRTCLVWEQKTGIYIPFISSVCPGGPTCGDPHDVSNTYQWCLGDDDKCDDPLNPPNGSVFTDFLTKLNTASFAGHNDWRLPTSGGGLFGLMPSGEPAELESICGPSLCAEGIAGTNDIEPAFRPTAIVFYWAANTFADNLEFVYKMFFDYDGVLNVGAKWHRDAVRAVRGGTGAPPSMASCSIDPQAIDRPARSEYQMTVTVESAGSRQSGVPVEVNVTGGPQSGAAGNGATDSVGEVFFSYTDMLGPGTDILVASGVIDGESFSCTATVTWQPPTCTISPASATSPLGTDHSFTVTVANSAGAPLSGITVRVDLIEGPNAPAGGSQVTDANGRIPVRYPGNGGPGTDTIRATGTVGGVGFSCEASKTWVSS